MSVPPYFTPDSDTPPLAPETERRVVAEEVATVYATLRSAVFAGAILAVVVAAVFFFHAGETSALAWLALFAVGKLRYPRIGAYFADPDPSRRSAYWSRSVTRELYVTSAIWGLAPWMVLP